LVIATKSGLAAFDQTRNQRSEVLNEVLAQWPAEDRVELVRLLSRFNAELEAAIAQRQAATDG